MRTQRECLLCEDAGDIPTNPLAQRLEQESAVFEDVPIPDVRQTSITVAEWEPMQARSLKKRLVNHARASNRTEGLYFHSLPR